MSIKITSKQELEQAQKNHYNSNIVRYTPLVLSPNTKNLYKRRDERLKKLATDDNPFQSYLQFCREIVRLQGDLFNQSTVPETLTLTQNELPPLQFEALINEQPKFLDELMEQVRYLLTHLESSSKESNETIKRLAKLNKHDLKLKVEALLTKQFDAVEAQDSIFIWNALSPYFVKLASQLNFKAEEQFGESRYLCPICNSYPIASVIHFGQNSGLRYLHCSLCESEWHVPRVKCTNCDNLEGLEFYSLNTEEAPIKAESCPKCHSYLKILNLDKDPEIDVIADDINSLILDQEMEKINSARTGLNPFLFG